MTRLQELLSETPTESEIEQADILADALNWEKVSGDPRPKMAQGRADKRRALVREVMFECAKVVCEHCAAHGLPIAENRPTHHVHDPDKTCGQQPCAAWVIYLILAQSGEKSSEKLGLKEKP